MKKNLVFQLSTCAIVSVLAACTGGGSSSSSPGSSLPASSIASSEVLASSSAMVISSISSSNVSNIASSTAPQPSSASAAAETDLIIQENALGFCLADGITNENKNPGFTGEGYVNTGNSLGVAIVWEVVAATSDIYNITLVYANAGPNNRGGLFTVNGGNTASHNVNLESTGDWTNWQAESFSFDLVQGKNTLSLAADTSEGLANIDYIKITGAGVTGAVCSHLPLSSSSIAMASSTPSQNSSSASSVNAANGTLISNEQEIIQALTTAKAGDVFLVKGGTYKFNTTIRMTSSGTNNSKIVFMGDPIDGSRPLFDFSAMSEASSNRGLILSGNYWHFKGIDIGHAGDNCMNISGSNNLIEFSSFFECADTGLQLGDGASNNTILNCDSYFNADSSNENADGFAAKLDVGTGNKFVGCRAWQNLDDGWDGYLRPADNIITTYENCWAIKNGYDKNGNRGIGDGNGFKTGGSDAVDGVKTLRHNAVYKQCIAAGNAVDGYDHNSNRGSVTIHNSIAHNNGTNINFSSTNPAQKLTIKNTISMGSGQSLNASSTDISNNSWQNGLSATDADFESVNIELLKSPRKADGSLPDIPYFKLKAGSDLINKGTPVGLPFNGSAPDLGPFETN